MVAGGGLLGLVVLAQPISVAYFTAVAWVGQAAGTAV